MSDIDFPLSVSGDFEAINEAAQKGAQAAVSGDRENVELWLHDILLLSQNIQRLLELWKDEEKK